MVSAMDQDYIIKESTIQKIGKIAKGGFGKVYKGLMQGRTEVAIKELYNQNLSQKALEDFQNEIVLMFRMRHPNVITVYGYCQSPLSLVMEFMPRSLFHLLHSNQEMPWDLRYNISLDIVQGLLYIHEKKIIHRDLKSLNILLDKNSNAKITDFGLSRIRTESFSQQTKSEVGTVSWMAPEIMRAKPKYSVQSDIFALGVTFWEIAARKVPFEGAKPEFVKDDIKAGEREEMPEDCPQEYQQIIAGCWLQNPDNRATLQETYEALLKMQKAFQKQPVNPLQINQNLATKQQQKPIQEESKFVLPAKNIQILKPGNQQKKTQEINKTEKLEQNVFKLQYDKSQGNSFILQISFFRAMLTELDLLRSLRTRTGQSLQVLIRRSKSGISRLEAV